MAYERLDKKYKAGQVWDEAAISHIDDGFDRVYSDLYNDKSTGGALVEYFNTFDVTSMRQFTATFAGWTGYIGTVKDISHVKFKFKAVSGYPVSMICIKFWELPDKSTLTPNENGIGYTPDVNSWNVISTTVKSFKAVTNTNTFTEDTVELETPIVNNSKQLVMGIDFNNVVSYPITFLDASTFPNDMPAFGVVTSSTRVPDYENLTEASIKNSRWNQTTSFLSTDFSFENPVKVVAPVCVIYNFEGGTTTSELGTQNKDKFSNLVKDVLTNAGIQDNIDLSASMVKTNFKSGIEKSYYKGSQNLDKNQAFKKNVVVTDQTSGFMWGIGKVPYDIMIAGFKTAIQCRIKSDSNYTTCTKVWGYLYESDVSPDVSSQGTDRLHVGTNATLVRTAEIDVSLDVASEATACC